MTAFHPRSTADRRLREPTRARPTTNVLRHSTIGIIGGGTMGRALMQGLLAHGVPPRAIRVSDPSAGVRGEAARRFGVHVTEDNLEVVRRSNIVILAVKPQQFAEVVAGIAPTITRGQLIISIAAGITLRWLQERLPDVPLVRVMPNLPATVGCGFSAVVLGRSTGARHRAKALALFQTVGEVVELPERHLDAITAVSGSGPAYVFFLVQMWEAAAASLGLPRSVAERAIRQTLEGSLRLLQASGEPASVLMGKVASKRGTTEAALKVLARQRVSVHFMEALRAAARRSKELSWS